METKLGIVIPNHNYAKWIKEAILSVAYDSYKYKRLAVIDDGSTDDSWDIISEVLSLQNTEPNMIHHGVIGDVPAFAYRYPEAGGPSRARNTGIKLLWKDTDLFGFLDSDDKYLHTKIEKSVRIFEEDPVHIGVIYSDYVTINDNNISTVEYKEPFSRERLIQECIVNNDSFVNKQALQICGLYDETLRTCEDYDLWLRISESFVIVHIPEPLVLIRVGRHSSTSTVQQTAWEENWKKVMDKMKSRYNGQQ